MGVQEPLIVLTYAPLYIFPRAKYKDTLAVIFLVFEESPYCSP
jgi:hypothetical protein